MSRRELENLKSTCEEGPYWAERPDHDLRKLTRKSYKIPEPDDSGEDGEYEEDGEDETALWMKNRPFTMFEALRLRPGSLDAATYAAWLRNRPSATQSAFSGSRLSDDLKRDLKALIAKELRTEQDSDFEEIPTIIDQQLDRVVKEVRDVYKGVRRHSDVLQDIKPEKYAVFRQTFNNIFVRGLHQEWAYQRNTFPMVHPRTHHLFDKVYKDMRRVISDATRTSRARQGDLLALGRKRVSWGRKARMTKDADRGTKRRRGEGEERDEGRGSVRRKVCNKSE